MLVQEELCLFTVITNIFQPSQVKARFEKYIFCGSEESVFMTSAGRMKGAAEFEANHNPPENHLRTPIFSEFIQGKATSRDHILYVCVYVYMYV